MALKLIPDPILRLGGGGLNVVNAAAAAQTYTQKVLALSPLGYWPLNGSANDASGNGYNGAATAVTYGTGIGDGGQAGVFDGSTSFVDIYSAGFAGAFNNQELTLAIWCKVSAAGVWADAKARQVFRLRADNSNIAVLARTATANQIQSNYLAGGSTKPINDTSLAASTAWFHLAVTVSKSGDAEKFYINGAQVGSTQTGLGTWAGALASNTTAIGSATNASSGLAWSGSLAHAVIFTSALSAAQVASLAAV